MRGVTAALATSYITGVGGKCKAFNEKSPGATCPGDLEKSSRSDIVGQVSVEIAEHVRLVGMAEIKHRQVGGGPGIEFAEINLPDDADWGTGSYTTIFAAKALPPLKVMMSAMINLPRFQITVSVNPSGEVAILLGEAEPKSRARVRLPWGLERARTHSLQIQFASWAVIGALPDGQAVPLTSQSVVKGVSADGISAV